MTAVVGVLQAGDDRLAVPTSAANRFCESPAFVRAY